MFPFLPYCGANERASYHKKPYAVLNNGEFIGYVVANDNKSCWAEVCVENEKHLDLTIKAWMEQNDYFTVKMF